MKFGIVYALYLENKMNGDRVFGNRYFPSKTSFLTFMDNLLKSSLFTCHLIFSRTWKFGIGILCGVIICFIIMLNSPEPEGVWMSQEEHTELMETLEHSSTIMEKIQYFIIERELSIDETIEWNKEALE